MHGQKNIKSLGTVSFSIMTEGEQFVASSEASLQHSSTVAVLLVTSFSWSYLPSIFGGYRLRFPPENAPIFDAKEPNKYISAARIVKTKKLITFILPSNHSFIHFLAYIN